jgi:pimeloyl-ACP methyl ester carboxylesterase
VRATQPQSGGTIAAAHRGDCFKIDIDVHETTVESRAVRFRVAGAGPPLVLVHGLAGSWRWWRPCVPALAERRTVYAVDLPGFGDLRRERCSLAEAPDFLRAWMDAVGLDTAALLGHSMGAAICARAAGAMPHRVPRLVLVSPAIDLRPSPRAYALPVARMAVTLRPRFATMLLGDTVRAGVFGVVRTARELLATPVLTDDLQRLTVPTLVVWGSRDPIVPRQTADALVARLQHARIHVIERAGHVPMVDTPDELTRVVLGHLA